MEAYPPASAAMGDGELHTLTTDADGSGRAMCACGGVFMDNKQKIYDLLYEIVGDGGCAGACSESELYQEDGEWKLFLCGFMEPWPLGATLAEVETHLREYAGQGFGLGV